MISYIDILEAPISPLPFDPQKIDAALTHLNRDFPYAYAPGSPRAPPAKGPPWFKPQSDACPVARLALAAPQGSLTRNSIPSRTGLCGFSNLVGAEQQIWFVGSELSSHTLRHMVC